MADNVTRGTGSELVSTEELTTLNGATVTAQHAQRVLGALMTAAGTVVDGVGLAHRLDAVNDAVLTSPKGGSSQNITASTLLLTGAGKLHGVFVAAASATPTIKFWDNTAASGTVLIGTFTPVAGTMYTFGVGGIRNTTGIYCTISGTVDCTPIWDPLTA